jgi:hypothetical protein
MMSTGLNLKSGEEEALIGWKGESFRPGDVFGRQVSFIFSPEDGP